MQPYALERQKEIYLNGFAGKMPDVPFTSDGLEEAAKKIISKKAFAYIAGGAGEEKTVKQNRTAFDKWQIVPQMLKNVSERDTSVTLLNKKLPSPFLLAPVGVLSLAHHDADLAVAKAAASENIPYIFSNQATVPMEVCAQAMNNQTKWFQLYWSKSRDLVESFLQRAEKCGCEALVVTLDTTMLGWRPRDLQLAYLPFLEGKGIAQYTSDPVFTEMLKTYQPQKAERTINMQTLRGLISMVNHYPGNGFFKKLKSGFPIKAVQLFTEMYTNPYTTWADLQFLREHTRLPIFLKGILHAQDAQRALDYGVDGIIVSNHGGRQVDGAIATLDALPQIANVVNKKIPVLLDSGVRSGADVFKAIALGANAVCFGRPYVYALAIQGENGVKQWIKNIKAEFELTMALSGCAHPSEINIDCMQTVVTQ
ncbi:MAG: lactate 2-monooxygenase [Chryseotalea sp.]|jgi:lactate 2-monooxygenase